MTDDELLAGFAAKTIPLDQWNHRKHLRLAYLHLRKFPLEEAIDRMRSGIKAYNAEKGIEESLMSGYHETMTQGWMRLIDFMIRQHGPCEDSESFYEAQPHLTQKSLLRLYYSKDQFVSEKAKMNFVEPDLAPFPVVAR